MAERCKRHSWGGAITCSRCPEIHPEASRWGWVRCAQGHVSNTNDSNTFGCPVCRPRSRVRDSRVPSLAEIKAVGRPRHGRW